MQLLLTDRLTCPRCGPMFGLILRADRMVERSVHEGVLGCPNCRDSFTIRAGFADLRAPPRSEMGRGLVGDPPESIAAGVADEGGVRLAALLGLVGGAGTVVLVGEPARHAVTMAAAVEEIMVVGVDEGLRFWAEAPGVSRMASSPGLPFFDRSVRGLALDARWVSGLAGEAARVLPRGARLVVTGSDELALEAIRAGPFEITAAEAETIVATRG